MASSSQFILFDIPTRDPIQCWSWNTWKTRFVLNFKGLDYKTEWTEYPDIKPRLEKHFPGETEFTCPTLRLGDGETYVMDSGKIADRLEADFPNPPLHLGSPYKDELIPHLRAAMIPLRPHYINMVPDRLLSEHSVPFFVEKREGDVGMPLEKYRETQGDNAWENSAEGFTGITKMLEKNTQGPFLMGDTVSYSDFILGGVLIFFKVLGDDVWAKVVEASGDGGKAFDAFLEGVKPWSERNSH